MNSQVRQPQYRGQFYPSGVELLTKSLDILFKDNRIERTKQVLSPSLVIVPHAGYDYSGYLQAQAYSRVNKDLIKTIFLIGSSHKYALESVALDNNVFWLSPLGKTLVDQEIVKTLSQSPLFSINNQFHTEEHSLEVQLPMIHYYFNQVKIVPLLVPNLGLEKMGQVVDELQSFVNHNTLFVISSDLAHYPNAKQIKEIDHKTIETIKSLELSKFEAWLSQDKAGYKGLEIFACGASAIKLGMMLANDNQWKDTQLFQYLHSGMITGREEKNVGYASIGFYDTNQFMDEHKIDLGKKYLKFARESLNYVLTNVKKLNLKFKHDKDFKKQVGIFVTLRMNGKLRGCIGQINPSQPLYITMPKVVEESALRDSRFEPVRVEELDQIKIELAILTKPKEIRDIAEIEIGKHGVIIEQGNVSGVFLPKVAPEFRWNRRQLLSNLCQNKMGLDENCWQGSNIKIYVFEARVFSE